MNIKKTFLVLSLCIPVAAHAGFREFTVHFKAEPRGKVRYTVPQEMIYYMDGNRMRQDIITNEGRAVVVLELDGDKLVSTILDMDEKTYMRTVSEADDESGILFRLPRGEESPCKNDPKFTCKRMGGGRFKGYKIIKWQVAKRGGGEPTVYWYAPALGIFLKSESSQMVLTATRIEDRAPPASRFKPPAGFREISYGAYLGGQGAAAARPPADSAGGPHEEHGGAAAPPAGEGSRADAAAGNEGTGAGPEGTGVAEELKDVLKNLFGK